MVDFSAVINRRGTDCCKWDGSDLDLGRTDIIQLGCADMDFQSPLEIRQELQKVVEHGVFGYSNMGQHFQEGIIEWFKKRHHITLEHDSIVFTPRINIACGLCIEAFTRPGDKVILNAPSYPPLLQAAEDNGRVVIDLPLKEQTINSEHRFTLDLDALASKVDSKTKMMILVSPHNPTTRIWTKEELQQVADFCVKHDLLLFVDEIHADFVKQGYDFTSMAEILGPIQDRLLLANSPAKTFNVMGCIVAYMIIPNKRLRQAFQREIDRVGEHNPTAFANAVMRVAYQKCDYYIDEVNRYIDENEAYLRQELQALFPKLKITPREGTYLLWLDFREVFSSEEEMEQFFIEKANIFVLSGSHFGTHFTKFARLNMACPKATLEEVIARIKKALA